MKLLKEHISVEKKYVLNAIAVFAALIGLANTAIAWFFYGTSASGDVWMLALVMLQSFNLLSQLGVEQVAVFGSRARALGKEEGDAFDRDSFAWAIWFGLVFASILLIMRDVVVDLFADGYPKNEKEALGGVFALLLMQIPLSPALYVLRQQLMLDGRIRLSLVSNSINSMSQLVVFLCAIAFEIRDQIYLSAMIGVASIVSSILFIEVTCGIKRAFKIPHWRGMLSFVWASIRMRGTHSIHNFFVVLLVNNFLSTGIEGTVAVFQYMKRLADGIGSVSVGPHLSVYHTSQSEAWAKTDKKKFILNIKQYAFSAGPLYIVFSTALFCFLLVLSITNLKYTENLTMSSLVVFIIILLWQLLIFVESIPVGVLIVQNASGILFFVNAFFLLNIFLVMCLVNPPYGAVLIATMCFLCQLISAVLIAYFAKRIYKLRFC